MKVDIDYLVLDARSIADVLATHKVFGFVDEKASPAVKAEFALRIPHEKERFVKTVVRHASSPQALQPETLQYHNTGAWVRFNTATVTSGRVSFLFVDVVPAFAVNPDLENDPNIDYIALAHDIHYVREANAQKLTTNI